ncbi:hypothetical protein GGTG_10284 [Gaeumannomyces tritici R3-111a-1]|uniref:Luciferase domain-containing protein n=1 Tax=Gaeumannomyces tritici (strain R3-111a-1) TaxID=644352 RepID=J3P9W0_GAET3|nr:hypothetical protein GGTG_10284 [Gaeumannomyces tritici R3-111a-1]EJT73446.1 hypothetical protein GGTG_10284 [Gaeumannomyces tritici R3-111a-1]
MFSSPETSASVLIGGKVAMTEHSPAMLPSPPHSATLGDESREHGLAINMVIRQDPFSITLDAPALLAVTMVLIFGMHTIEQHMFACILVSMPILLLIRNDYNNFLNLGPGGTPPTPAGYVRLAWYRIFALRDPFTPPPTSPDKIPTMGILQEQPLSFRAGPRPSVAGLAPQRQLDQWGSWQLCELLKTAIESLCARYPAKFGVGTSSIEKHGFALFARHPVNVCGNGEIVHLHSSDKSMHMNLHPDDIKEVLQRGWGQRHPLSFKGWVQSPLPDTFMMIYAPRDQNDLQITCKIIEAAIWYTTAEKIELNLAESP